MDRPAVLPFHLGDWSVDPVRSRIVRDGETSRLEPRMMRLLLCLAAHAGEIVSADDLLDEAWPGVVVSPDSVYQGVAALRRVLGDDPKNPRYIVTVPRQGYRMIAAITPSSATTPASTPASTPDFPLFNAFTAPPPFPEWRVTIASGIVIAALLLVAAAATVAVREWRADDAAAHAAVAAANAKSIAVLPFLDLTESMGEEVFADGMTEELIDKFSRIPGLRVPPPTASFWFKDKQMTVAEIARKLGVAWVLDGSVRKSGSTMRIAARLVRASDGFVVWSETYDRPIDDRLMVQDDIAGEVRKAIEATIARHVPAPGSH